MKKKKPVRSSLPRILQINQIENKKLRISVLFSTGEDRILDFKRIFKSVWKVTKTDPEYKLINPVEFGKVKLADHTLSWANVPFFITGFDGKKKKVPYQVGADTLYDLSEVDERDVRIQNLSEQIKEVDKMLKLHSSNPSKLMFKQYKAKKEKLERNLIDELAEAIISKPIKASEKKELSAFIKNLKVSSKNEIKKYNKEVDTAVENVRKGKSISNKKVMKDMDKW